MTGMTGSIIVTETELLDALRASTRASGEGPAGAKTVQELVDELRWSERAVRKALKRLHVAGSLRVHRVERIRMDGGRCIVPAYAVVGPTKKSSRLSQPRRAR
jgi:hypothetical protein